MTQPLVIGASGLVGEHLVAALKSAGQTPISTYRNTSIPSALALDITRQKDVQNLFSSTKPDLVFLPAALTNVDYCELHPDEAYDINVRGVQNVVKAANMTKSRVIYFSSDYIFDGKDGPYDEEATANPISHYGSQKLSAEHYISLFAEDYLIVRTTVIYGWERQGKNFVHRLLETLKKSMNIKVPFDQIGSPTYANNLAEIIVDLSSSNLSGIINVSGSDCISRYDFARATAQTFNLNEDLILPAQTNELNQPAKRPLKAGLKAAKVLAMTRIPLISFHEGLKLMVDNQGQRNL